MYVIGTAGHVDHGKSTLVHALTGMDPDRLQEEKARGMTIDLGFAWLTLPSGKEISIVDVPGHERFIKNMLAGVGGIDLALLVIAADEGVMPQTREHLAILDLLGITHGLVVLTKRDLVDDEWLELIQADVEEALKGTTLEGAPMLPVSATTKEGLPELLAVLDRLLLDTPIRRDTGRPRLPIDRVFTIAGFGTVVTGTLIDGALTAGQEVEVLPSGVRTRIRGLQSHRTKAETLAPGARVAANLAGVSTDDVLRGDTVTTPGWLRPTDAIDVRLRLLAGAPSAMKHNATCTFHSLTTEAVARVRLLDTQELKPGETAWAQLRLSAPAAVVPGDAFILRSSAGTVGGGTVVEPHAKRHKRFHEGTLTRLATLREGTPDQQLLETLDKLQPIDLTGLFKASNLAEADARAALALLVADGRVTVLGAKALGPASQLVTTPTWDRLAATALEALQAFHRQFPLRVGMPKEDLRSRLRLPNRPAGDAMDSLVQRRLIDEHAAAVAAPGFHVSFSPEQAKQTEALLTQLARQPFTSLAELNAQPEVIAALVDQGRLLRMAEDICFPPDAFAAMAARVRAHLTEHGKITVAEVRDMFDTSRKYAIAFMEYLDQQRVTRRVGDERVLR